MKLIIAVIQPFNMANDCEAWSVIPAETKTPTCLRRAKNEVDFFA